MWLRNARAWSAAGCLALASAGSASADPTVVKCWTWDHPYGDVDEDPRFTQMIEIEMVSPSTPHPVAKSGFCAGVEAAWAVYDRELTSADDVWVFFTGFAQGRWPHPGAIANGWYYGQTIFCHENDDLPPDPTEPCHLELKPWVKNGVNEMKGWIEDFIDGYLAGQECIELHTSEVIPLIGRCHLDTEVHFNMGFGIPMVVSDGQESVNIFAWMMEDPRWEEDDELLGFPEQSLEELFENAKTLGGWDFHSDVDYYNALNVGWANWYTSLCNTVRNFAMYEAVYEPLYNAFGTISSDYGATILADGAGEDPLFGRDRYLHEPCANGGYWKKYTFDGPHAGGAPIPYQAPVLYSIDDDFYDPMIFNPPWGGACGGLEDPDDCQFRANMQYYRDLLNTCMRSYLHTPSVFMPFTVTPWVSIPDHVYITHGEPCSPYFSYTQPQLRELLSLCSARAIEELIVWTNPYDTTDIAAKWQGFQNALNFAYYADVTGYDVTAGTGSSNWPTPVSYANADPLEIEAEEDGEDYIAEVEIDFVVADAPTTVQAMTVNAEAWLACTSCSGASVPTPAFTMEVWALDTLSDPDAWVLLDSVPISLSRDVDDPLILAIDHVLVENYIDENQTGKLKVVFISNGYAFNAYLDMLQLVRTDEPPPSP